MNKTLRFNNLKTRITMDEKISVFVDYDIGLKYKSCLV